MDFTIVIPVFNEEESIRALLDEISESVSKYSFEIVVVDDCSSDTTLEVLSQSKNSLENLRVISHDQNLGQSSAIHTGVSNAKSNWIVTLDGDGQNDPKDISSLFHKIQEINNDQLMIAGHRVVRKDNWLKRFSSKYANKIRRKILNDDIPDTGCGLKIFSRDMFLKLPFFEHMHRYIPALFRSYGGQVLSIPVNHRQREKGSSKYGFSNRFWVGIIDLIGVKWLQKRSKIVTYKEK